MIPILSLALLLLALKASAFTTPSSSLSTLYHGSMLTTWPLSATVTPSMKESVLQSWNVQEANDYAEQFGLTETEATLYGLVQALRQGLPMGLKGMPLVLRQEDLPSSSLQGFFTMQHLEKALEDDFLDAARGSTDNRKGWKITTVSNPRGDSFEEARMTYDDVLAALDKGTVIFNAAGAHIPRLAGPSLAVTDAASTPNAMNVYITAPGKRTSAPPHTDKQDVIVCQTLGSKFWRVYAPTDPSDKPLADVFARGKGEDSLPLHILQESGTLLIETTLNAGDILFVPAGFPHTTGTAMSEESNDTSVHLTFNLDTHVWDLDYLSLRRLAVRRAKVEDTALGQARDEDNRYVGKVNQLPLDLHADIMEMIPFGFLDPEPPQEATVAMVTKELRRIAHAVDSTTANQVPETIWQETVERLRDHGMELLEIHRDMYLAAIDEGRTREAEDAMTAHLGKRKTMTPERMQRLSLFRVQRYYEKITAAKDKLLEWSYSGTSEPTSATPTLPENWAFTMPIKVGDSVEADLGGAFFPATITRVVMGDRYDVKFFDGDTEAGVERSRLKLLKPPNLASDSDATSSNGDTSNMTPKQLKRWKKQQEKMNKIR